MFAVGLALGACGGGGTLTGAGGNMAAGRGGRGGTPPISTGSGGGTGVTGAAGTGGWIDPTEEACLKDYVAQPVLPTLLIVLDAAASMNDDMSHATCAGGCGLDSKWALAADAINTAIADPDERASWGIELFGLNKTNVCSAFDASIGTGTSFGSTEAIASALTRNTSPNGGVLGGTGRPTRGAIYGAISLLDTVTSSGEKAIVLVTDGVPGCALDASITNDTGAAVDAITAAWVAGYATFVVGLATAGGPANDSMMMMAAAGDRSGVGLRGIYQSVSNTTQLRSALLSAVSVIGGCTFAAPPPPTDHISRERIGVRLNGVEILRDRTRTSGWDFTDASATSIRLFGDVCSAADVAGQGAVTIHFYCPLP